MDTNVFQYVIAVAESGSISGASRKLFISQPALTKQISRLESHLGAKLFERNKTPLTVTETGKLFLEYAYGYLELEKRFQEQLERIGQKETEHLLVGTTHRGGGYVGDRTAAFLKSYGDIRLEYLDMSAEECEAALEQEKIALAVYTDPVLSDCVEYMPLEEDVLVWAVPKNSPLLEGKNLEGNSLDCLIEIEPEEFQKQDITYILSTSDHSLYHAENAFLKKYRIHPVHSFRVDYVDTRYSIACGGGGIVLVPTTTVKKNFGSSDVAYCTVKGDTIYRYVIIAKKKGRTLPKGAEAFWKFMVKQRFNRDNNLE